MSEESVVERVCRIVATIFNVPAEEVNAQSSPETIENWDSMGQLMLVLELEQEFNTQFDPEQVEQMHDVAGIVKIVEAAH